MRFDIEIKRRPPDSSRNFRDLLEMNLNIRTDDDGIILRENDVSILELCDDFVDWDKGGRKGEFVYSPDAYTCGPMLRIVKIEHDNEYGIFGVDCGAPTINRVSAVEFNKFVAEFCKNMSLLI